MSYQQQHMQPYLFLLLITVFVTGCDDSVTSNPYSCTRDEVMLAEQRDCYGDENCPCGAHCSLGECVHDCLSDDDCTDGLTCSAFGRCGSSGFSQPLAPPYDGRIVSHHPRQLEFPETGVERSLQIAVEGTNLGAMRVVGRNGLEVRCTPEGSYAESCMIDPPPQPGELVVSVRSSAPIPESDEHGEVQIFIGDQRVTVGGTRWGSQESIGEDRPEGIYRGYIEPVTSGSTARSTGVELPEEVRSIRIPVTVTIYPGDSIAHTITIADDLGALFPVDGAVGQLVSQSDEGWSLSMPARSFIQSESVVGTVEVWIADIDSEPAEWSGEALSAQLTTLFEGSTLPLHSPYLTWNLVTTHAEPLPDGATAPDVPAPYVPMLDPIRASEPLNLGSAAASFLEEALAELSGSSNAHFASATLCTDASDSAPVLLGDTVFHPADSTSRTGDLACPGSAAPDTFGIMSSNLLDINESINDCMNDLERVNPDGESLAPLESNGCVDSSRVLAVLDYALKADRDRVLGNGFETDMTASTIGTRLLQQWLAVLTFLSRETLQVEELQEILDVSEADSLPVTSADALMASTIGLDILLHPRIAVALAALPPSALSSPDYRTRLYPDGDYPNGRSNDQRIGLPANIMDTSRTQLETLTRLVERVNNGRLSEMNEEVTLNLSQELVPRVLVLLALSESMHAGLRHTGEPDWEPEWRTARHGMSVSLRTLVGAFASLGEDVNVLGIQDGDLPLYQVGDQDTARRRFSALTDFLVGRNDGGVAQYMVDRAEDALLDVRSAWLANVERDLDAELATIEQSRRLEEINRRYGGEVNSLCGALPWENTDVLAHADEIDASTCFMDPSCIPSTETLSERISTAELGYSLCQVQLLRRLYRNAVTTGIPNLDSTLDRLGRLFDAPLGPFPVEITRRSGDEVTVSFTDGVSTSFSLSDFATSLQTPTTADAEDMQNILAVCDSARQHTLALRPAENPPTCSSTDDCSAAQLCLDGTCAMDDFGDRPECYAGSIGEQALTVMAASREIEMARSELNDMIDRLTIAMNECHIMAFSNRGEQALLASTNGVLSALNTAKMLMDIGAALANAAYDACSFDKNAASFGGGATAAVLRGIFESISIGLQFAMDEIERWRDFALTAMQNWEEETICINNASMEIVGFRTASLRIEQATFDLTREQAALEALRSDVAGLLREGRVAYETEQNRTVNPLATDFWFYEEINEYQQLMRQARRVTYLAVLGAEYEHQMTSTGWRDDTLAATTPDELQDVLDSVWAGTATGTIAGGSPSDDLEVISLRDHLLQLADTSSYPDGWHQLNAAERFRLLLTSSTNAVYDENGEYLGQEIPFSITPLGVMNIGDAQGIPLLSGMNCAERLWSVNASILGLEGQELSVGTDGTTFARIVLRKRNTFFSQWCSDELRDDPFQIASTRPSRNLFLDPMGCDYEDAMPSSNGDSTDEINAYTTARIRAYFNVSRAEMEDESYFNGDSQELAGRGLYGDYALFFPAETLLGVNGNEQGVNLDAVEDILLRLDYVSVARD